MLSKVLDERSRRLLVAAESKAWGRGGVSAVSRATGVSRQVIRRGLGELQQPAAPPAGRIRRPGGGRKKAVEKDPALLVELEKLLEPATRGDPESPLRWSCKSVRKLAAELQKKKELVGDFGRGIRSATRWWRNYLLHQMDYSLQGTTARPLRLWLRAMWHITSQKHGASALGLQRVLGLGSYQTAWTGMHKLRPAMVRPGRERLTGVVAVDESYWGAEEEGVIGRQTERKALIAVAAEERGAGLGRLRMQRVKDASAASLMPFVEQSVEPGSVVRSDDWSGYDPLKKKDYQRRIVTIKHHREQASELLPKVHLAISLLKRWLLGTHQGAVSHEHLDYYLDEFVFRFNRRRSRSRGKLFYRLVQQAVAVEPTPYRSIVADWDAEPL